MQKTASTHDYLAPRIYKKHECAYFCRVAERFGELSNMNKHFPLQLGELVIASTENLYQALRFPDYPDLQMQILTEPKPMVSKMIAYDDANIVKTTPLWLSQNLNINAMRTCLYLKSVQHQQRIHLILESTEKAPIVELSKKDAFWGAKPQQDPDILIGTNLLGRLWEAQREQMFALDFKAFSQVKPIHHSLFLLGKPLAEHFKHGAAQ